MAMPASPADQKKHALESAWSLAEVAANLLVEKGEERKAVAYAEVAQAWALIAEAAKLQ